jgi:2-polyprenyl-3-methyl-5-hydroxy-6-metoxy-1,4-benzoquinol methylase
VVGGRDRRRRRAPEAGGVLSAIDFARARIVGERLEWLRPFVASGAVLDLGCIDERHPERIAESLHARLKQLNPNVVGADLDADAIDVVTRLGFEVRRVDAHSDELGGPYDVIFAGELIEHLDDPGRFLDNVRRHLTPGGRLLVTTPNPFYLNQFAKILKYGRPQVHDRHRTWFCPETLAVLLRSRGFEIEDFVWLEARRGAWRQALARWRPYWSAGFAVATRPAT